MKGVVMFDTYYGNTRRVAEAIAEELRADGHEADLRNVKASHATPPAGDFMFLGSPVRMGAVTGRVKRFVKRLDESEWKDKPIVVFTTTLALPEDATEAQKESQEKRDRGAGRKLRDLVRGRGLHAVDDHLWVEVAGMKGPLTDQALPKTRQFTHDAVRSFTG